MRIGMVLLDHGFPPDIRVENEARTLTKEGHEVFLITRRLPGESAEEKAYGIQVHRFPLTRFKKVGTLVHRLTTYEYHPYWSGKIKQFIQEENIEVLHVHDLPFSEIAIKASKESGIPIVVDLHEIYPELMKEYKRNLSSRLFNNPEKLEKAEERAIRRADHLIAVSPAMKEYYERKYHLKPEKITSVANYADLEFLMNLPIEEEVVRKYRDRFTMIYAGVIATHKVPFEVLEAVKKISQHIPDCLLLLVGNEWSYTEKLKSKARELSIEENVEFTGHVPIEKIPSYISASKIGLLPLRLTTNQGHLASPHKLFQYMAFSKPVIASRTKSIAKIIEGERCGLVFELRNASELAQCALELADEKKREEMGKRGAEAVRKKYNWESQGRNLLQLYEELGK
ncbi:MAG: glycosyltransferase family 4 protein [Actinomycetota bacterium]|nr:glycosyltransferase family 4 protein [Actinomycetota bacterium]